MVVISFAVKRRFLAQSVERQELALVQTGLIVALAMCEASALFGLVDALCYRTSLLLCCHDSWRFGNSGPLSSP